MAARVLGTSALAAAVLAAVSLGTACGPSGSTSPSAGGDAGARVARTTGRGGDCATCHMAEYEHADPVHVDVKPTTCGVCHVQDAWRPSVVHHEQWPLTGAHQGRPDTQCLWCHKGTPSVFKGTSKECVSCHREDYDASTFPEHGTFPTKCAECHTTTAWRPATHPPPRAPAPVAAPAASPSKLAPLPKGKTAPKSPTPTRPTATTLPTATPRTPPLPTTPVPTTRPPDVISRPSRRR